MPQKFHVGVKAVIVNDSKALILRSKSSIGPTDSYWDLPGGRIDGNESILEALRRELSEEILNLQQYRLGKLLLTWRYPINTADQIGFILVIYKVTAELAAPILSAEHSEYRWVNSSEVTALSRDSNTEFPAGHQKAIKLALK